MSACIDADGFLTLRDRSKDLIISGGANIYPREVEEVLLQHPAVAEAAVVGRPDPEWGEMVVAFVVRGGGREAAAELDAHCLAQIARFKRPKDYRFVAALPKNNYGKVLKTELRELARATSPQPAAALPRASAAGAQAARITAGTQRLHSKLFARNGHWNSSRGIPEYAPTFLVCSLVTLISSARVALQAAADLNTRTSRHSSSGASVMAETSVRMPSRSSAAGLGRDLLEQALQRSTMLLAEAVGAAGEARPVPGQELEGLAERHHDDVLGRRDQHEVFLRDVRGDRGGGSDVCAQAPSSASRRRRRRR